jgi:HEAT repeat protein
MTATSPMERAAAAATLGRRARISPAEQAELELLVHSDPDARVRSVALGALVHAGPRRRAAAAWRTAARDADGNVRRRAAELAPALRGAASAGVLLTLLADDEPLVAEAAAFALGEHPGATRRVIARLGRAATTHDDALVREAAVAALGAIGDPSALPMVLVACDDKPAVRRRAVLALAAFDGEAVEARLRQALEDRDWQTRAAAEQLLGQSEE